MTQDGRKSCLSCGRELPFDFSSLDRLPDKTVDQFLVYTASHGTMPIGSPSRMGRERGWHCAFVAVLAIIVSCVPRTRHRNTVQRLLSTPSIFFSWTEEVLGATCKREHYPLPNVVLSPGFSSHPFVWAPLERIRN